MRGRQVRAGHPAHPGVPRDAGRRRGGRGLYSRNVDALDLHTLSHMSSSSVRRTAHIITLTRFSAMGIYSYVNKLRRGASDIKHTSNVR